jgi:hypothetical protein
VAGQLAGIVESYVRLLAARERATQQQQRQLGHAGSLCRLPLGSVRELRGLTAEWLHSDALQAMLDITSNLLGLAWHSTTVSTAASSSSSSSSRGSVDGHLIVEVVGLYLDLWTHAAGDSMARQGGRGGGQG